MTNMAFQVARESTLVAASRYQRALGAAQRAYRQGVRHGEELAGSAVRAARAEAPSLLGQAARHARTAVSALDRQLGRVEGAFSPPAAVRPDGHPAPPKAAAYTRGKATADPGKSAPPKAAPARETVSS